MSDVMFYGVLRMPYEMVVANNISLIQFYGRAQEAANRVEGAEAELTAARALLREVIADTGIVSHIDACQRAQEYLDACDTLEGK